MERKIEIIAYHGWGMNAHFWDKWDDLLPGHVTFKKNDRGYFGEPAHHEFSDPKAIHVLFVQGFGIHWVSEENWQKAHIIVLYSAFKNLKDIMLNTRQVDKVLQKLKSEITNQVYRTLGMFWDSMFNHENHDFVQIDEFEIRDRQLLLDDLEVYYDDIIQSVPFNKKARILLYETEFDNIDTQSQKEAIKNLFGKLDYYKCFDIRGHGFPFSHPAECYNDLKQVI